ncbi:hypothetical protein BASA81_015872 [Batrachochytrium salamandrivorans]|nr:hypothetical protein BASA81_017383 [Batrachochytrium salamandrivorans]KAH9246605.1 hypothetical protein BASA81_015872 [Batrachochytrium salamandrivorans]
MSWKDYVKNQLIDTLHVKEGAILSAEDGSLWASSPETFCPRAYLGTVMDESGAEHDELINEAANLAEVARTLKKPRAGLRINHQKYMIVRSMERGSLDDGLRTIFFKRPGGGGGTLCVTNQCIIIGTFDELLGQSSASCTATVEHLGRYLKQNGF